MKFYESIGIRPPDEEFERYARTRIDVLTRLGENQELESYLAALELGQRLIKESMGRRDDDH